MSQRDEAAAPSIAAQALREAAELLARVREMEGEPPGSGSEEDEQAFKEWDEHSRAAWDETDAAVRWLRNRAARIANPDG